MASQNYASAVLDQIDERFSLDAKTSGIVNKNDVRLEWNGKNSVTIYNVNVVAENDYIRSGTDRFGPLLELGNGVQTFVLSQDKGFTFSVDRGNLEDSQMVTEANKAVKRQVKEVSIPTTDIYRLGVLQAYAVANSQYATAAITNTNAYQKFLAQNDSMTDDKVPEEGRHCFLAPATYSLMKRDPEFSKACDESYKDLKTGVLGQVDGVTFHKVPTSYLPANTGYLLVHEKLMISPTKFNSVRVLTEQRGIDGAVAEGRRYYDAFIPTQKAKSVRVHMVA